MSKRAEEAALKAYPYFPTEVNLFGHKTITADGNSCYRGIYIKGYDQAVKDTIQMIRDEIEYGLLRIKISSIRSAQMEGSEYTLTSILSFLDELEKLPKED